MLIRRFVLAVIALGLWATFVDADAVALRRHMAVIGGINGGGGGGGGQVGDVATLIVQNESGSTQAAGFRTFGHPFKIGDLAAGDVLGARINSTIYCVQRDDKAKNSDNSKRHSVLTVNTPAIAANSSANMVLTKNPPGGCVAPPGSAPTSAALIAGGYSVSIAFTWYELDGSNSAETINCATPLSGASPSWLSGTQVNEFNVQTTVHSGKLKVKCNIRAYADGAISTDVVFDNGWFFNSGKGTNTYDVTITQSGATTYNSTSQVKHVVQYIFTQWHHEMLKGVINQNVHYDIAYLRDAGAILPYDTTYGCGSAQVTSYLNQFVTGHNYGPMLPGIIDTQWFSVAGGNPMLAPQTNWMSLWLMCQSDASRDLMLRVADIGGAVPWYYIDESQDGGKGRPINVVTYNDIQNPNGSGTLVPTSQGGCCGYNLHDITNLSCSAGTVTVTISVGGGLPPVSEKRWVVLSAFNGDYTGYNGPQIATFTSTGFTFPATCVTNTSTNVRIDGNAFFIWPAHMPDLSYIAYMATGSKFYLEMTEVQANFSMWSSWGYGLGLDFLTGTFRTGFSSGFYTGHGTSNGQESRAIAWEVRQVTQAAYIVPDADPLKAVYTGELAVSMAAEVALWITQDLNGTAHLNGNTGYGEIKGFIGGHVGPGPADIPWQDAFNTITRFETARMDHGAASTNARDFTRNFQANYVAGLFTNGPKGFDPLAGTPYVYNTNHNRCDGGTCTSTYPDMNTWNAYYNLTDNVNLGWTDSTSSGGHSTDPHVNPGWIINYCYPGGQAGAMGGYPQILKAGLASLINSIGLGADSGNTPLSQVIHAHTFVTSRLLDCVLKQGGSRALVNDDYRDHPQFALVPKLPSGKYLMNNQVVIDQTGSSSITLTPPIAGQDSMMVIMGAGNNQSIIGGTGTTDIMMCHQGTCTLTAGTGNDYMFGGSGATTFVDNTGNNWMEGATVDIAVSYAANNYKFLVNASGQDKVKNFRTGTDTLTIKQNLNGNGLTTAAQVVAATTVVSGNCVINLGGGNTVTVMDQTVPANLQSSITMTP